MSAGLTPFQAMVAAGTAQPDLMDVEELQGVMSADEMKHSARWVAVRKPKVYEAIVRCLGWDFPVKAIALAFEVSPKTVRAIREIESESLAPLKRSLVGEMRKLVSALVDRLNEEVDKMDIDKLPIALGIAIEKLLLLEGQATQIVQHRSGPSVAATAQRIREIQAKVTTIQETRSGGENALQNGAELPAASAARAGAPTADMVDTNHPQN
jgi:hypothetical protein